MSSIIPFDSGRSYVVRGIDIKQAEHRFTDRLGRTEEDRRFLEQFEIIFCAAAEGNLEQCKKIVAQGFNDFNAFSVGKFGSAGGTPLNISPLKVAERNKNQEVVDYFKSQMHKSVPSLAEKIAAKDGMTT